MSINQRKILCDIVLVDKHTYETTVCATIHTVIQCSIILKALSKSVADGFAYFGDASMTETETFVRHFDRLFDCPTYEASLNGKRRQNLI